MNHWIRSTIIVFVLGLIAGSQCVGQQFIITERHQDFIVTDRIDEPTIVKEVQIKNWKPKQLSTDDEFYAVMFTAKWCGPCQTYKKSGKLERLKERFATTVVDVDDEPQWRVNHVPAFWLCRRSDRTKVKSWSGSTDVSTIESEVTRIRSTKSGTAVKVTTVSTSRNTSLFGRRGTSHESRETLIYHLSNEGIHRGKWSVIELQGMSDDALDALHSNDHGWR